jgi:hypothetical protein
MIPAGKRGYSFFLRGLECLAVLSRDHHVGKLPRVSLFLTLRGRCVPVISQFSAPESFRLHLQRIGRAVCRILGIGSSGWTLPPLGILRSFPYIILM